MLELSDVLGVGQRRAVHDHLAGVDVLVDRRAAGVPAACAVEADVARHVPLPRRAVLCVDQLVAGPSSAAMASLTLCENPRV